MIYEEKRIIKDNFQAFCFNSWVNETVLCYFSEEIWREELVGRISKAAF